MMALQLIVFLPLLAAHGHRIVLEVAWEALEHSGIAPESLRGSRTGVFLGITAGDYALNAMEAAKSRLGVHIVSGITPNAAAGRIASSSRCR